LKFGWKFVWQLKVPHSQHYQMHCRTELGKREHTIFGHVRQLPDLGELIERQFGPFEKGLGYRACDETVQIRLHRFELFLVVAVQLWLDGPDVHVIKVVVLVIVIIIVIKLVFFVII
jgi:hypothetical protein